MAAAFGAFQAFAEFASYARSNQCLALVAFTVSLAGLPASVLIVIGYGAKLINDGTLSQSDLLRCALLQA
jgi:hypothetical protein